MTRPICPDPLGLDGSSRCMGARVCQQRVAWCAPGVPPEVLQARTGDGVWPVVTAPWSVAQVVAAAGSACCVCCGGRDLSMHSRPCMAAGGADKSQKHKKAEKPTKKQTKNTEGVWRFGAGGVGKCWSMSVPAAYRLLWWLCGCLEDGAAARGACCKPLPTLLVHTCTHNLAAAAGPWSVGWMDDVGCSSKWMVPGSTSLVALKRGG